jgi:CheY-like chemotaxis protein
LAGETGVSLSGVRVLVVEDDPVLRGLYRAMLGAELAEVVEAGDGGEGLEAFARHRPDVVVSDLRMPRMDGLTMVRRLLDQGQAPAVVFVTGTGFALDDSPEGARLMQENGFRLLQKPFGKNELLELLGQALWTRSAGAAQA